MLGIKRQPATRSVIGAGMRVQGPCTFSDGLQIDGEVLGDVTAEGGQPSVLVIGEGGSVVGPVLARELLELQSKARVQGDVRYKTLEMQQGAVIAGQLQPQLTPPPAAARESQAQEPTDLRSPPPAEPTEPTLDFDRP